jgi:hypothetical protein
MTNLPYRRHKKQYHIFFINGIKLRTQTVKAEVLSETHHEPRAHTRRKRSTAQRQKKRGEKKRRSKKKKQLQRPTPKCQRRKLRRRGV